MSWIPLAEGRADFHAHGEGGTTGQPAGTGSGLSKGCCKTSGITSHRKAQEYTEPAVCPGLGAAGHFLGGPGTGSQRPRGGGNASRVAACHSLHCGVPCKPHCTRGERGVSCGSREGSATGKPRSQGTCGLAGSCSPGCPVQLLLSAQEAQAWCQLSKALPGHASELEFTQLCLTKFGEAAITTRQT